MENRLRQIRKELKYTQEELAHRLGIGKSALSMIETGRAALSERNKRILVNELNVNPDWLNTGKGNMFSAPPQRKLMEGRDVLPAQSVPLFNLDQTGGLSELLDEDKNFKPVDYIYVPNLPKCDGAVYVMGDGMYPLLKSGDIVMYKKVKNIEDIFWGDLYLLAIDMDGTEYITVKYIYRSDKPGSVKLSGHNTDHGYKTVETSRIKAIALVKASIRLHSMG